MKLGSLFSGYGGLDMAVMQHFGASLEWYAEFDKAPSAIMAAHHPGIPNFGDVTKIDWINVPDIDILTGGYPCQPFSHAGLRKGTNDARHLWPYVREAISHLRPGIVVLENVRGHLTLGFDTVLGEISALGYDAQWSLVRASDVGAPHQRARLFIVAHTNGYARSEPQRTNRNVHGATGTQLHGTDWQIVRRSDSTTTDSKYDGYVGAAKRRSLGESKDERRLLKSEGCHATFGEYQAAISQWEQVTGRRCPDPIDTDDRLEPRFVEWMMGLPEGWVSNHDLTWTAQLKMLGNGVVPQQAKYALELLT